ncbi:MAG TPA: hypothetical protein VFF06_29980 [Polyangia bacterium]|nr:hypothetical protein [Polyangia bacterium]
MDKSRSGNIDEAARRLEADVERLGHAVEKRGSELRERAFSFIHDHPYAAVGAAFGVGYLISGALFSRATLKLAGFGGRFLAGALLKQVVAGGGLGFLAPDVQNYAPETER